MRKFAGIAKKKRSYHAQISLSMANSLRLDRQNDEPKRSTLKDSHISGEIDEWRLQPIL